MQAARDTVVSLKISLYDAQDVLLQAAPEPIAYLHGGYGGLLPALEARIEGASEGEALEVRLEPEDAFGEYDAALVHVEPLERYGEGLEVGMEVEDSFDSAGEPRLYTVTDIAGGKAVLDGNHPLAGMALRFVCQVVSVRSAMPEEIERGVSLPQG